jgi:single-strand DNA-binding protein
MINRVILVGRLTRDPQTRKTPNGASVTSFTVACDRRGQKVEGQPTADFINCVCWNRTADVVAQYTHKGSLVGVEGRIQTRSYDDQNGRRVFVTEVLADSVQFLEPKGNAQPNMNQPMMNSSMNQNMGQMSPNYGMPQQPYGNDFNSGFGNGFASNNYGGQPSYANDFSGGDTLDIASDDLPF